MFYLSELWHLSPNEVYKLGYGLRKRLVEKKVDLEKKREQDARRNSSTRRGGVR